jgi:hypothetical protein
MDTKLKKSATFHPQNDEQKEVVNRTMVLFLQGYCSKQPKFVEITNTTERGG